MQVITKIVQRKKSNNYDLYLDDHFFLTVNDDFLVEFQLIKGKILTDEMVKQLTEQSSVAEAYQISIKKLSYSMRSVGEIRHILRQEKFQANIIDEVVEKLQNQNYLNDENFAQLYLKELIRTTHYGPKVVEQKMRKKFLSEEIIGKVLPDYTSSVQIEKIRHDYETILSKKSNTGSANKFVEKEKIKLMRWGFDLDLVNQVQSEFDLSSIEESEIKAIEKEGQRLMQRYDNLEPRLRKQKIKQTLYRKGYLSDNINEFIDRCNF